MKKIAVLSLILVLCLAIISVGYAKWSDTLIINGEVSTAELSVGMRDVCTDDAGPNFQNGGDLIPNLQASDYDPCVNGTPDPAMAPGHNDEGKNVASHSSCNGDPVCTKNGIQYYDSITETIVNAYPYYKSGTIIEIVNCGTIPVKIDSLTSNFVSGSEDLMPWLVIDSWNIMDNGGIVNSGTGSSGLEASLAEYQLDPCHTMEIDVDFYFQECDSGSDCSGNLMPQGANASFQWGITCSQWNEVP